MGRVGSVGHWSHPYRKRHQGLPLSKRQLGMYDNRSRQTSTRLEYRPIDRHVIKESRAIFTNIPAFDSSSFYQKNGGISQFQPPGPNLQLSGCSPASILLITLLFSTCVTNAYGNNAQIILDQKHDLALQRGEAVQIYQEGSHIHPSKQCFIEVPGDRSRALVFSNLYVECERIEIYNPLSVEKGAMFLRTVPRADSKKNCPLIDPSGDRHQDGLVDFALRMGAPPAPGATKHMALYHMCNAIFKCEGRKGLEGTSCNGFGNRLDKDLVFGGGWVRVKWGVNVTVKEAYIISDGPFVMEPYSGLVGKVVVGIYSNSVKPSLHLSPAAYLYSPSSGLTPDEINRRFAAILNGERSSTALLPEKLKGSSLVSQSLIDTPLEVKQSIPGDVSTPMSALIKSTDKISLFIMTRFDQTYRAAFVGSKGKNVFISFEGNIKFKSLKLISIQKDRSFWKNTVTTHETVIPCNIKGETAVVALCGTAGFESSQANGEVQVCADTFNGIGTASKVQTKSDYLLKTTHESHEKVIPAIFFGDVSIITRITSIESVIFQRKKILIYSYEKISWNRMTEEHSHSSRGFSAEVSFQPPLSVAGLTLSSSTGLKVNAQIPFESTTSALTQEGNDPLALALATHKLWNKVKGATQFLQGFNPVSVSAIYQRTSVRWQTLGPGNSHLQSLIVQTPLLRLGGGLEVIADEMNIKANRVEETPTILSQTIKSSTIGVSAGIGANPSVSAFGGRVREKNQQAVYPYFSSPKMTWIVEEHKKMPSPPSSITKKAFSARIGYRPRGRNYYVQDLSYFLKKNGDVRQYEVALSELYEDLDRLITPFLLPATRKASAAASPSPVADEEVPFAPKFEASDFEPIEEKLFEKILTPQFFSGFIEGIAHAWGESTQIPKDFKGIAKHYLDLLSHVIPLKVARRAKFTHQQITGSFTYLNKENEERWQRDPLKELRVLAHSVEKESPKSLGEKMGYLMVGSLLVKCPELDILLTLTQHHKISSEYETKPEIKIWKAIFQKIMN